MTRDSALLGGPPHLTFVAQKLCLQSLMEVWIEFCSIEFDLERSVGSRWLGRKRRFLLATLVASFKQVIRHDDAIVRPHLQAKIQEVICQQNLLPRILIWSSHFCSIIVLKVDCHE